MTEEKKKRKTFFKKLKNKYRLVILNADTFEEKVSIRLSRLNVFVIIVAASVLLVIATTYIIAFTPLKEFIPGYGSQSERTLRNLMLKADSLEEDVKQKDLYLYNIKNIMEGKEVVDKLPEKPDSSASNYDNINFTKSKEDSLLRIEVEAQEKYNLAEGISVGSAAASSISNLFFFTPLKGIVTNNFNITSGHYGVDIVSKKNEAIKSTLDGTVIFASWTLKTGYTIAIQHKENLISVYKHNSVLLKREGEYVKAGEVIAIIGETGELSTGPHLHFELWFNGSPVNPKDYMVF